MKVAIDDRSHRSDVTRLTSLILLGAAALQVVCGGVRFQDGSVLLQLTQFGFQANLEDFSQFLFDSPLKILFLQAMHLNTVPSIGVLFLVLNFLPLIVILSLSRRADERCQLLAITCIMPIWKLMFQNTGVGDSVIIAGTILTVVARSRLTVASAAFVMSLWHFQQGILILLIIIALDAAERGVHFRGRPLFLAIGAAAGVVSFFAIEAFLVPPHVGRLGYVSMLLSTYLQKNILFLPIACCAIVPGTILMVAALQRLNRHRLLVLAAILATVLAIGIGAITADFSRVMLLLTFPTVLFVANPRAEPSRFPVELLTPQHLVPLLAIAVVTPLFASWSGIDIFLWPRLHNTFQKYLSSAF